MTCLLPILTYSRSQLTPLATRLTNGFQRAMASSPERFDSVFSMQAPFDSGAYSEFAMSTLSNLLGGIGYFYGDSKADLLHVPAYEEREEHFWTETERARARHASSTLPAAELFATTPSRPFFPRGFLWDEGFHLQLVAVWDLDLAAEILKSWYSLMDEDGWIAREQILGPEARSKVPPEFQVQYPHYANPPTLFATASHIVDVLEGREAYAGHDSTLFRDAAAGRAYVAWLYPLLKRHHAWFRKTQAGDVASYARPRGAVGSEGYRWRGRTPQHTLTSGLDDYPRSQPPHPGELHVDALAWVGMMTSSLGKIAGYLGEGKDEKTFEKQLVAVRRNLELLHWSEKDGIFCDASVEGNTTHVLACNEGYVSFGPFWVAGGLIDPQSKMMGKLLKALSDKGGMWSEHGIRSLSRRHELFGTEENY